MAFISHHSSQIEAARHLARILERNGIKGWMAPDDIDPGMPFDKVIIDQIGKSDVILLLFCARSDQSKHVKREIMLAEQNGKLIYPIRLETIQPDGLAYWLQDYQWIDWLDQRDGAVERMVATIRRQLSLTDEPEAEPEPAPAPTPAPTPAPAPPPPTPAPTPAPPPPAPNPPGDRHARFGLDSKAMIAIGGVGVLLLLLIAAAMNMEEDGGVTPEPTPLAVVGPQPGASSAPSPLINDYPAGSIEPGLWESSVQIADFHSTVPGLTRESLGAMNQGSNSRDCISPQEAANPTQALVDLAKSAEGDCTTNKMQFFGGLISGRMSCSQGGGQVRSELDLGGKYTPSSIDLDFNVTQSAQQGGQGYEVRYILRMASRRVGEC